MKLTKLILKELAKDRRRALLSLLAMVIGMSAFGLVLFCHAIILREIPQVFSTANPASASVLVDRVDDELHELLSSFEGIADYDKSGYYAYQVKVGDHWQSLELFAAEDYTKKTFHQVTQLAGKMVLEKGDALIEGDALSIAKAGIGDMITVKQRTGEERELQLIGAVNDVNVHPASIHQVVYLYVNFETLEEWGIQPNKIDYYIAGDPYDKEQILQVSNAFISLLQQHGYTVQQLQVSDTPGVSMHLAEYAGALTLLQLFAVISLLVSCMMMNSLLSSILSKQTRQVGIIKAIGGSYRQIAGAYLRALSIVIALAAILSSSIVLLCSGKLAELLLGIANIIPVSTAVPLPVCVGFLACIIFLPLLIAARPIIRGLRISVNAALMPQRNLFGTQSNASFSSSWLSRPVQLSIRNTLRQKGRFFINAISLILAGALFIATVSTMLAVQRAINANVGMLKYDYQVTVSGETTTTQIAAAVDEVPELAEYEVWNNTAVQLLDDQQQIGNSYTLIALPIDSRMLEPDMLNGQWFEAQTRQVVVTKKFLDKENIYGVGDSITLLINGTQQAFDITGVINDFDTAGIYVDQAAFNQLVPVNNRQQSIKLTTKGKGNKRKQYAAISAAFEQAGMFVYSSDSIQDLKGNISGHYSVTLQTFLVIVFLLIAIAWCGLSATMNVQATERRQEMAVMKVMGGSRKQIIHLITAESLFICMFSCLGAMLLGSLLTVLATPLFGEVIQVPLTIRAQPMLMTILLWSGLSLLIGYLASRSVAKRTARLNVATIFNSL